uniref:Uncharacterized protein n=1 Tax=Acrobeloides nanus TaxID=290746 RepID=A0A914CNH6_9BILA
MGCQCAKPEKIKVNFDDIDGKRRPSAYLALAFMNASTAASIVTSDLGMQRLENQYVDQLIRKAKNDGQTVSIVNGCLFLDYKFIGYLPQGFCA